MNLTPQKTPEAGHSEPDLQSGLRVIPEIRAAHLDIDTVAPRRLLYYRRNYDLQREAVPGHASQVSLLRACFEIARTRSGALELFEPMWIRHALSWCVLGTVWRFTRFGRPRSARACFFAIENNAPLEIVTGERRWLSGPARLMLRLFGWVIPQLVSHCVFGTDEAARRYKSLIGVESVESRVILDLRSAQPIDTASAIPRSAAFVGVLEERKGLLRLMDAWERVEQLVPGAHLTLVGDGPLAANVRSWVAVAPKSREWLGVQPRSCVLALLANTAVLIAPSVRSGRWREQIGGPIQEALSCGATVVTTSETGLADFLRANGHYVIDEAVLPRDLVPAIRAALLDPLSRTAVLASLPIEDSRVVADRWLHGVDRRAA